MDVQPAAPKNILPEMSIQKPDFLPGTMGSFINSCTADLVPTSWRDMSLRGVDTPIVWTVQLLAFGHKKKPAGCICEEGVGAGQNLGKHRKGATVYTPEKPTYPLKIHGWKMTCRLKMVPLFRDIRPLFLEGGILRFSPSEFRTDHRNFLKA